jgi:hypothetical protein
MTDNHSSSGRVEAPQQAKGNCIGCGQIAPCKECPRPEPQRYILRSLESFAKDEPDSDFQKGFRAALQAVLDEANWHIPDPAQAGRKRTSGILTLDVGEWTLSVRVLDGGYEVSITEDGKCPATHYVRLDHEQSDTLHDFVVETSAAQPPAAPVEMDRVMDSILCYLAKGCGLILDDLSAADFENLRGLINRAPVRRSSAATEPAGWIVDRPGDPTFPRFYHTEDEAKAMEAFITVSPRGNVRPVFTHAPQTSFDQDEAYHLFLTLDTEARRYKGENETINYLRERLLPAYRDWHAANPHRAHPGLTLPRPQGGGQ